MECICKSVIETYHSHLDTIERMQVEQIVNVIMGYIEIMIHFI